MKVTTPNKEEDLYVEVLCFLTFNVCAMLGSLTTSWIQWVKSDIFRFCSLYAFMFLTFYLISNFQPTKKFLVFPVLFRIVFVPLFLMCNCYPEQRNIPVYIQSDWLYWGIGAIMAYTSGYLRLIDSTTTKIE